LPTIALTKTVLVFYKVRNLTIKLNLYPFQQNDAKMFIWKKMKMENSIKNVRSTSDIYILLLK